MKVENTGLSTDKSSATGFPIFFGETCESPTTIIHQNNNNNRNDVLTEKNRSGFVLAQLSASTIKGKLKILEPRDTGKMENRSLGALR